MANQYSADVPKGFNVPKQVRLDSVTGVQNELTLKNLGPGNNLAFKYYEGVKVYCKDEKKEYIWRQVVGSETGLLTTHFVYPTYPSIDGVDYSGKSFNFFLVTNNGTSANGSETKINSGTNTTVTGLGTIASPYVINSTDTVANGSETKINEGDNITITGNGTQSTPYIINADLTDLGIIKTVNNEVISPTQSLSIINNELTGKVLVTKEYVQSIIPATADGSETKLNPGDNITITGSGTISNPYIINSISNAGSVYINPGDNIEIIGNGTVENPYVITSIGTNTTYSAGTGVSLIGTTFNNTAPDQVVSLTQGGATTITGTYPNFTISSTGATADGSETKLTASTNITITGLGTIASPYVISSVDTNTTYLAGAGLVLSGTTFNIENLQKVITYPADFSGTNYTLTNADNNYEIIINNGATAVTITVPSGLTSKIGVGFTQKGTGDITYTASGTTINNPTGLKIKGQFHQTYLSQELSTNNYFLGGSTKI